MKEVKMSAFSRTAGIDGEATRLLARAVTRPTTLAFFCFALPYTIRRRLLDELSSHVESVVSSFVMRSTIDGMPLDIDVQSVAGVNVALATNSFTKET